MVIIGVLSSSLILPFSSNLNQATRPEKYNTATYISVGMMETARSEGYTKIREDIEAATNPLTINTTQNVGGRNYTKIEVDEYVSHSVGPPGIFSFSSAPTVYIRVTTTVSTPGITGISMSEILARDFYNPFANL
jgi:hypothetical protein